MQGCTESKASGISSNVMNLNSVDDLLLSRFRKDRLDIQSKFNIFETDLVRSLEEIKDRVGFWLFHFESGKKLLYKPKDISMDEAYEAFIQVLGTRLVAAKSLNYGEYGWQEYLSDKLPTTVCEDYYYAGGLLLGIAYKLGAHDLYVDNIRIKDGKPTPIDAEMMLYPHWYGENVKSSVLSTCLLPEKYTDSQGRISDVGGLYFPKEGMNNDKIIKELIEGYKASVQFMNTISADEIYRCFDSAKVSVVIHSSTTYSKLRNELLRNGEPTFRKIAEFLLKRQDLPDDVVQYEIACLLEDKEPKFTMRTDSTDLMCGNSIMVPNFATASPIENALKNMACSSQDSIQIKMIKESLNK